MRRNYKGEITVCFRHEEFKDPSFLLTGRGHTTWEPLVGLDLFLNTGCLSGSSGALKN